jgi:hypothetical protein
VEAANAEVQASNKEREGLSSSMLQRLKKAAGDYEVLTISIKDMIAC